MSFSWAWLGGLLSVCGIGAGVLCPLIWGIWDVVRQRRGEDLSVTASNWLTRFAARHPIAVWFSGLALGILAGHLLWYQVYCPGV